MSQGLTKTKRRIQSITSTRKITKAMDLVATVKLKRWRESMENTLYYLRNLEEIVFSCSCSEKDREEIPELKTVGSDSRLLVVVTSSLGLCGGYNYNLYKFLDGQLNKNDKVLIVGTKGYAHYANGSFDPDPRYLNLLDKFDYAKASDLVREIVTAYRSGKYREVVLISTTYRNSLTFVPEEMRLLPLSGVFADDANSILYEPNRGEVLKELIPKYLNTLVYAKMTEAIVSEYASRRNAMDSANDNADELLEKLQIEFNKARQAAITQEITEVVGGTINK